MSADLLALLLTAASIGLVHTVLGPDHYVPFIAMAKARGWSMTRTISITALCGIGHVLGSVTLGALGIALGWAVGGLEAVEGFRGELAGWLLLGFGLAYAAWGLRQAYRDRPHSHLHRHGDGTAHVHVHRHRGEHSHLHRAKGRTLTPWILFTIFVFGPCEPLIPVLMYPAARGSWIGVAAVALVFAVVTILTMSAMVALGVRGLSRARLGGLERFAHALAGGALTLCGGAILLGF